MKRIAVFVLFLAAGSARAALLPMIRLEAPPAPPPLAPLPAIRMPRAPSRPAPRIENPMIRLPGAYQPHEIMPGSEIWELPGIRQPSQSEPRVWAQARQVLGAAKAGSAAEFNQVFNNESAEKPAQLPVPTAPSQEEIRREQPISIPASEKPQTIPEWDLKLDIGLP